LDTAITSPATDNFRGLDHGDGVSHASPMAAMTAVVARVPSLVEAQLIVGMLQSNGIDAAVSADDAGGFDPQLQLTQGVRVLVAADDEARARLLVAEADAGQS
jgi:hypothetical protein